MDTSFDSVPDMASNPRPATLKLEDGLAFVDHLVTQLGVLLFRRKTEILGPDAKDLSNVYISKLSEVERLSGDQVKRSLSLIQKSLVQFAGGLDRLPGSVPSSVGGESQLGGSQIVPSATSGKPTLAPVRGAEVVGHIAQKLLDIGNALCPPPPPPVKKNRILANTKKLFGGGSSDKKKEEAEAAKPAKPTSKDKPETIEDQRDDSVEFMLLDTMRRLFNAHVEVNSGRAQGLTHVPDEIADFAFSYVAFFHAPAVRHIAGAVLAVLSKADMDRLVGMISGGLSGVNKDDRAREYVPYQKAARGLAWSMQKHFERAAMIGYLTQLAKAMEKVDRGVLRAEIALTVSSIMKTTITGNDFRKRAFASFLAGATEQVGAFWSAFNKLWALFIKWSKKPKHALFCYETLVSMKAVTAEDFQGEQALQLVQLLTAAYRNKEIRTRALELTAEYFEAIPEGAVSGNKEGFVNHMGLVSPMLWPKKSVPVGDEATALMSVVVAFGRKDLHGSVTYLRETLLSTLTTAEQKAVVLRGLGQLAHESGPKVSGYNYMLYPLTEPLLLGGKREEGDGASSEETIQLPGGDVNSTLLAAVLPTFPFISNPDKEAKLAIMERISRLFLSDERPVQQAAVFALRDYLLEDPGVNTVPVLRSVVEVMSEASTDQALVASEEESQIAMKALLNLGFLLDTFAESETEVQANPEFGAVRETVEGLCLLWVAHSEPFVRVEAVRILHMLAGEAFRALEGDAPGRLAHLADAIPSNLDGVSDVWDTVLEPLLGRRYGEFSTAIRWAWERLAVRLPMLPTGDDGWLLWEATVRFLAAGVRVGDAEFDSVGSSVPSRVFLVRLLEMLARDVGDPRIRGTVLTQLCSVVPSVVEVLLKLAREFDAGSIEGVGALSAQEKERFSEGEIMLWGGILERMDTKWFHGATKVRSHFGTVLNGWLDQKPGSSAISKKPSVRASMARVVKRFIDLTWPAGRLGVSPMPTSPTGVKIESSPGSAAAFTFSPDDPQFRIAVLKFVAGLLPSAVRGDEKAVAEAISLAGVKNRGELEHDVRDAESAVVAALGAILRCGSVENKVMRSSVVELVLKSLGRGRHLIGPVQECLEALLAFNPVLARMFFVRSFQTPDDGGPDSGAGSAMGKTSPWAVSTGFLRAMVTNWTDDLGRWLSASHGLPVVVVALTVLLHQASPSAVSRQLACSLAVEAGRHGGAGLDVGEDLFAGSHVSSSVYIATASRYSRSLARRRPELTVGMLEESANLLNEGTLGRPWVELLLHLLEPWAENFEKLLPEGAGRGFGAGSSSGAGTTTRGAEGGGADGDGDEGDGDDAAAVRMSEVSTLSIENEGVSVNAGLSSLMRVTRAAIACGGGALVLCDRLWEAASQSGRCRDAILEGCIERWVSAGGMRPIDLVEQEACSAVVSIVAREAPRGSVLGALVGRLRGYSGAVPERASEFQRWYAAQKEKEAMRSARRRASTLSGSQEGGIGHPPTKEEAAFHLVLDLVYAEPEPERLHEHLAELLHTAVVWQGPESAALVSHVLQSVGWRGARLVEVLALRNSGHVVDPVSVVAGESPVSTPSDGAHDGARLSIEDGTVLATVAALERAGVENIRDAWGQVALGWAMAAGGNAGVESVRLYGVLKAATGGYARSDVVSAVQLLVGALKGGEQDKVDALLRLFVDIAGAGGESAETVANVAVHLIPTASVVRFKSVVAVIDAAGEACGGRRAVLKRVFEARWTGEQPDVDVFGALFRGMSHVETEVLTLSLLEDVVAVMGPDEFGLEEDDFSMTVAGLMLGYVLGAVESGDVALWSDRLKSYMHSGVPPAWGEGLAELLGALLGGTGLLEEFWTSFASVMPGEHGMRFGMRSVMGLLGGCGDSGQRRAVLLECLHWVLLTFREVSLTDDEWADVCALVMDAAYNGVPKVRDAAMAIYGTLLAERTTAREGIERLNFFRDYARRGSADGGVLNKTGLFASLRGAPTLVSAEQHGAVSRLDEYGSGLAEALDAAAESGVDVYAVPGERKPGAELLGDYVVQLPSEATPVVGVVYDSEEEVEGLAAEAISSRGDGDSSDEEGREGSVGVVEVIDGSSGGEELPAAPVDEDSSDEEGRRAAELAAATPETEGDGEVGSGEEVESGENGDGEGDEIELSYAETPEREDSAVLEEDEGDGGESGEESGDGAEEKDDGGDGKRVDPSTVLSDGDLDLSEDVTSDGE